MVTTSFTWNVNANVPTKKYKPLPIRTADSLSKCLHMCTHFIYNFRNCNKTHVKI